MNLKFKTQKIKIGFADNSKFKIQNSKFLLMSICLGRVLTALMWSLYSWQDPHCRWQSTCSK